MNVKAEVKKINEAMKSLKDALDFVQQECKHEPLIGTFRGGSDNWDRNDNSYWVNLFCSDCGKHWIEDQEEVEYPHKDGEWMHISKSGFKFKKV